MKSLIFLVLSFLTANSEDKLQVKLDVGFQVENVQVYHINDDINEKVSEEFISFKNSEITLYVKEYKDYLLIVNNEEVLTLTVESYEPVDERDITLSFDGTYEFRKGVLCLKFDNHLTSK